MSYEVPAVPTKWGEPWNQHQLVVRFDAILRAIGVDQVQVRRRMSGLAYFASGWRQATWCYNAWASMKGGWKHGFYKKSGYEWRAYVSIAQAYDDFRVFHLKRYAQARQLLFDPGVTDYDYFLELFLAGYGDPNTPVESDAKACTLRAQRYTQEMASASEAELAAADVYAADYTQGKTAAGGGADPDVDEEHDDEDLVDGDLVGDGDTVEDAMLEHVGLSLDEWSFLIINGVLLVLGIITLATWAAKRG